MTPHEKTKSTHIDTTKCMLSLSVISDSPTLGDSMDCSLAGSSVPGILQPRILKWGKGTKTTHEDKIQKSPTRQALSHVVEALEKQRSGP